jgi:hypothetical protein
LARIDLDVQLGAHFFQVTALFDLQQQLFHLPGFFDHTGGMFDGNLQAWGMMPDVLP